MTITSRRFRSDFVTNHQFSRSSRPFHVESRVADAKALPLDWLLGHKSRSFSDRVLARLIQCEAREVNPHLRDDYRQAFITLALAQQGSPLPFVEASYRMYGVHPDQVWPKMMACRRWMLGPAKLFTPKKSAPAQPAEERKRA
jgi:hypothetical protein